MSRATTYIEALPITETVAEYLGKEAGFLEPEAASPGAPTTVGVIARLKRYAEIELTPDSECVQFDADSRPALAIFSPKGVIGLVSSPINAFADECFNEEDEEVGMIMTRNQQARINYVRLIADTFEWGFVAHSRSLDEEEGGIVGMTRIKAHIDPKSEETTADVKFFASILKRVPKPS